MATFTSVQQEAVIARLNIQPVSIIRTRKVPLRVKAQAYELYRCGLSLTELARVLAVSRQTADKWVDAFKPYTGDHPETVVKKSKKI